MVFIYSITNITLLKQQPQNFHFGPFLFVVSPSLAICGESLAIRGDHNLGGAWSYGTYKIFSYVRAPLY